MKDLDEDLNVAEAEWSFGQIIPLALLSTSLIPIIELVFEAFFPRALGDPCPVHYPKLPAARADDCIRTY
ncbi:hypothetical protein CSOJ01_11264 [Colletotrichum sojae]|uniref:Uncharacterized protein n=1 Tax=Colletotrichum sojae TaxID=2175907 RepID=A0A8H6MN36_9PEZI|nr:hypothetical protein CSOJ01_11264 [Colletotrichum sojae]